MDLGKLDAAEHPATTYDWKFHHSLPALIIWVVVALTVVLVKSNRNVRAAAVLAPLAILAFAWTPAANLLGISGLNRQMFGIMFYSAIAGVSMLWLLSDRLSRLHFLVRPLAALGILMLACLAGMVGHGLDADLLAQLGIFEFVLLLAVVLSTAIAGVLCFKRYGRLRYSLRLVATTLGACLAAVVVFGLIGFIVSVGRGDFSIEDMKRILPQMLIVGLAASAFLYAIQLVFLLPALSTPFYRERFCKCLGLRQVSIGVTADASPAQTEPSQLGQKEIESG